MSRWQGGGGGAGVTFRGPHVPGLIKVIIGLVLLASLGGALLGHAGYPLLQYGVLIPANVWRGEVWRLVTWQLFEVEPFNLVIAVLMLYWFAGDLYDQFGKRKFLMLYFGVAILVGGATCVVARFWPAVMASVYLGGWPLADAMTIAWALSFPSREIYLFFVARVGGRTLVLITVGITVLYAIFHGLVPYLPHFIAEGLTLLYLGEGRRWYLKWRMQRLQKQGRRYLRAVEDTDKHEDKKGPPAGRPPKWLN